MSQPRITLREADRVLGELEPRLGRPGYWVLRRVADLFGVVDAARTVVNGRPATRLLDPLDVCLLRCWYRAQADCVQPRLVIAAALASHRAPLREVFRRRLDRVLVVRGLSSQVVPSAVASHLPGEQIGLCEVPLGVIEAMREVRAAQPCVWDGCRMSRLTDVETVPSSQAALVGVV